MKKILVSGLLNTETTVKIRGFPIEYYPIDYPFFGIKTRVSGVGYNIAKALRTLNEDINLISMLGQDFAATTIKNELQKLNISTQFLNANLADTPTSVVLYDEVGKRQIYCDLKDIQERHLNITKEVFWDCDYFVACNINFNRTLLPIAKENGLTIATDVHVLHDIDDSYNQIFMQYADILFLSDEALPCEAVEFLKRLSDKYCNHIIVLGQGAKGTTLYERETDCLYQLSAVYNDKVVNTVGAGDALFSSFLHFYHKGLTALESLKRAEIFASLKVSSNGASEGFTDEQTVEERYNRTEIPIKNYKIT